MKQRKDNVIRPHPPRPQNFESAFDVWLQNSLHKLFDDVANEPVPEDLLRLIEQDRSSRGERNK
jgi:hypothetical protein